MGTFLRHSFKRIRPSSRTPWLVRHPGRQIGPHQPQKVRSFGVRQNLALIDWPVVFTAGAFSLLFAGLLTATAYSLSRPVSQSSDRISWAAQRTSKLRALPPTAALEVARPGQDRCSSQQLLHSSPAIKEKVPETFSRGLNVPVSHEAALNQYPEGFPLVASNVVNQTQIAESTKTRGDLRQQSPLPIADGPVNLEPSQGIESTTCKQDSCGGDYGTSLKFAKDPAEAFRIAGENKKLVFLLHVSGNFEDARFT